jgi:hypothetical protein
MNSTHNTNRANKIHSKFFMENPKIIYNFGAGGIFIYGYNTPFSVS